MKTSYYAKFSKLSEEEKRKYYVVSISRYSPKWFNGIDEKCEYLYPHADDLKKIKNKEMSEEEFIDNYISHLDNEVYMDRLIEYFYNKEIISEKEVVFICYEKPSDFCHRKILSQYVYDKFRIEIEELTYD